MTYAPPGYPGGYGPPPSPNSGVDFGWIGEAWGYFKANAGAWIGALLLMMVCVLALEFGLFAATGVLGQMMSNQARATTTPQYLGVLMAVTVASQMLTAGLYRMAHRQVTGETVSAGDLFAIGDVFTPLLAYGLALSILPVTTQFITAGMNSASSTNPLAALPALAVILIVNGLVQFFLAFTSVAIVVDRVGVVEALGKSVRIVSANWAGLLGYFIVLGLAAFAGFVACCVGMFATMPLLYIGTVLAYIRLGGTGGPGPNAFASPPGMWPPPPSMGGPDASPPPYDPYAAPQPYGQSAPPDYGQPAPPSGWSSQPAQTPYGQAPPPPYAQPTIPPAGWPTQSEPPPAPPSPREPRPPLDPPASG